MRRSLSRLFILVGAIPALLVLSALIYMAGMAILEGENRSFWEAFEFVSETLSTTGYGADAKWSHPAMVLFVVLLQFIGVFLVFLIIPIYLVPFLEERFEERLPRRAPDSIHDHVIVYHYGPAVESLVDQLKDAHVSLLVVEPNESAARRLLERDIPVVFAPDDENAMDICQLMRARAVVANGPDEENVAIILRARQMGFNRDIYALSDDPARRRPMELAGANIVYTPNHILAAALAARSSERISPRISGIQQIGELQLREIRIQLGSPLAGKSLGESNLGARSGATVIGQWVGGKLDTQPAAETRLEPHSILIVVGSPESLDRLEGLAEGARPIREKGPFVIAGFGEVGSKVHQLLTDAGESARTIDRESRTGVDLVGNVLDSVVLRNAGIETARAVILALDSDDATLFATVIIRDLSPLVPIIARVNKARNVENIHRAGADFALSISQVSGQMLSYRLLGQEALAVDQKLKVLKTSGRHFSGRHPAQIGIREKTFCSVVAVERGDSVIVDFDAGFRFQSGDTVFVCGSESSVREFLEKYPSS